MWDRWMGRVPKLQLCLEDTKPMPRAGICRAEQRPLPLVPGVLPCPHFYTMGQCRPSEEDKVGSQRRSWCEGQEAWRATQVTWGR